jgi:uncharacterized protein DUF1697
MVTGSQWAPGGTDRKEGLWMTRYVALLRAVNVGGTGKLPMSELWAMCCEAGFAGVETYIASGNVVPMRSRTFPDSKMSRCASVKERSSFTTRAA